MLMTDALSSQKPLVPNMLNTQANLALKPSSETDLHKVDLARVPGRHASHYLSKR